MSVKQRKILKIVVVIVVVVLGFCLNESGILPALGGMGLMFAVFLPISAIPFAVLLMTGVFWRISSTQRLERRLGISLLAAGLLIGLGLPAWGNLQTPAFRVIASIFISEQQNIYPYHFNPQEFTVECSILPGGDVPPGATVILTNTMKTSIAYSVFLGPISMLYEPKQSVRVDLPPGESRRLSQPLAFWMLGSQVIATSGQTAANCSMLWASWRWLVVVGALLALAGLLCLGAGAYRNRRSSVSLHQG